jgi:hypothetical protein
MSTVKDIGCCSWGVHWLTSIVNPIRGTAVSHWDGSRLLLFAFDPYPDVRRAVAKRDAIAFASTKEADCVSIHEDDVLEIQHKGSAPRFIGEQRGQLAYVVGIELTTHGEHDVAICIALDFQH